MPVSAALSRSVSVDNARPAANSFSGDRFTVIASDLLRRGHAIRFSAPGTSMYPAIRNGETIHVHPVRPKEIRRGDILLYCWERGIRAHRVVRIEGAGHSSLAFILRGDSGGDAERVLAEKVLGQVISLERAGRQIRLRGPGAFARHALHRSASRMIQAYRKSLAAR
jgi:signal peptidase I